MKWVSVGGGRKINQKIKDDIKKAVSEKMKQGFGLVSGGAPGVDFYATKVALEFDPKCERIKIFLPTNLDIYFKYFKSRIESGIILESEFLELKNQLEYIKSKNPYALVENDEKEVNKDSFHKRNAQIVDFADELLSFWVNKDSGTGFAIEYAKQKGVPVKIYEYTINFD